MDVFEHQLATAVISCDSPRFLSFIPAAPTKASLLFDMVVACSSLQGTSWMEAAGAVAAENQALGVLADLAGLPAGAGGCFVSGGSAGNLSALMVARDTAAHRMGGRAPGRPLVADQRGGPLLGGQSAPGPGRRGPAGALRRPPAHREGLAPALDAAPARRPMPSGWWRPAGTTNAGIIDDLAGVADVAAERSLWFHVDGAYGCAALFAPSVRRPVRRHRAGRLLRGRPPQVAVRPFDCAALLYRAAEPGQGGPHPGRLLSRRAPQRRSEEWNPSDYAYHLTRRARGLPLWFSLAVNGTDAYRDAIETVLGRDPADRRSHRADSPPRAGPPARALGGPLPTASGGTGPTTRPGRPSCSPTRSDFVTPTTWEGEPVGRLALLHPDTTIAIIEEILATMA